MTGFAAAVMIFVGALCGTILGQIILDIIRDGL